MWKRNDAVAKMQKHTTAKQNMQRRGKSRQERNVTLKEDKDPKGEEKHNSKHKKIHHNNLNLENNLARIWIQKLKGKMTEQ